MAYAAAFVAPAAFTALLVAVPGWPKPYSWQYLGVTMAVGVLGGVAPGLIALAMSVVAVLWLGVPTPLHPGAEMFAATGACLLGLLHRWRRTEAALTERAEALRQSQATLDAFIEAAPGIVALLDEQLRFMNTDAATPRYLGLDRRSIRGRALEEVAPDLAAALAPILRDVLATGEPRLHREIRGPVPGRGGRPGWFIAYCFPVMLAGGSRGLGVIAVDVTEAKHAEAALRESTTLLRAISDGSGDAIFAKDLAGRLQFANPATLALIGKPRDQVIGRTDVEFLADKEAARRVMETDRRVMESGEPIEIEELIRQSDGTERIWLSRKSPYREADGHVIGVLGISRDITARKRAEAALTDANEQLRNADRQKNQFIAVLSHELRNPLAPIRTAVSLLDTHGPDDPLLRRCREVIDRQVSHMARLLDDLLDVSRLSRGKLILRRRTVALKEVVEAAIETTRPLMDEQRHRFVLDLPDEPVFLDADPARLTQVFGNLLNNAAKYSNPGSAISIAAQRDGDSVAVTVRDHGIGIPSEFIDRVFDLFTQADTSIERSQGGLGIGLSLVRWLVEMHGGLVEAQSDGPGQGSAFTVRLPAARPGTPRESEPPVAAPASRAGVRRRVLVADDNADAAEMVSVLLADAGCEVYTVYDGEAAVREANRLQPDVILLDIGMPGLDGHEACRRIREQPWSGATRIIALTGWGQDEDRRRSAAAGFDQHLVKPVDPEALIHALGDTSCRIV